MAQLGYSSLTLTDLTDTLSVNILLDSSLDQDFQRKLDTKYEPDFTKIGEELIITPTLLLGNEKIDIPVIPEKRTGYIYYQIGDFDENGKEINYYYGGQAESSNVYVDRQGKLHYKKNLSKNLKIKAYIDNFTIKDNDILIDRVDTLVPIEIIFFEPQSEIYGYITSQDGREWFEESMRDDITLEVKLYSGEEISDPSNYVYKWEIAAGDIRELTDTYKVIIDKDNKHLIKIKRSAINSMQVFICTITGESLTTPIILTKEIRDLSDKYDCDFISDKPLIFSPDVQELNITARLWEKKNQINQEATNSRFKYTWYLYLKNSSDAIVIKSNSSEKTLKLRSNDYYIPKDDFTLYCEILIDNKYLAIEKDIIKYNSFSVTPYLSSKNYTFPANENGTYQGTETKISKTFVFQLLEAGTNKPIFYDEETSVMPVLQKPQNSTDTTTLEVYQRESEDSTRRWNFNLELSLDMTGTNDLWKENVTSKTYEFTYTFLDETFNEKIEIIKNVQGKTGPQGNTGQSGYSVQLTNDFHLFAGGEVAAKPDSTSFDISVYYGDKLLKITKIELNGKELGNKKSNTNGIISGIKISRTDTTENNGTISTITLEVPKNNEQKLTQGGSLGITVTANEKTFFKTFNYGVNYNGDSYSLLFDVNQINYFPSLNSFSNLTINISPQRKEGGTPPQSYTSGKVFWGFLNGENYTWTQISSHSGGVYKKTFEAAQLLQQKNIYFKLEDSEGTILDKETIPILRSMEGTEIGGENLIKWSKNLTLEQNKWTGTTGASIGQDGDFSYLNFDDTIKTETFAFYSPKMVFDLDYLNKKVCLSFWVYSDDWNTLDDGAGQYFSVQLRGFEKYDTTTRYLHKQIGYIYRGGETTFSKEEEGLLPTGKWIKIYKTFSLENFSFVEGDTEQDLSKCKYFCLMFYTKNNGALRIKKPKLEFGNIPTDWSPSPYDINLENVTGINLLSFAESFKVEIPEKEIYKDFEIELKKGKNYTISWSSTSSTNSATSKFYCRLYTGSVRENNLSEEPKVSKTYSIDQTQVSFLYSAEDTSTYTLRIYARNNTASITSKEIFTIKQLKVELGENPTNYYVTGDLIQDIVSSMEEDYAGAEERLVKIEEDTGTIETTLDELEEIIEGLQSSSVDIDEVNGAISLYTKKFYEGIIDETDSNYQNSLYFTQIKNAIELVTDSEDGAYIQISSFIGDQTNTTTLKNFYTKITSDRLSFYGNNKEIAFISGENLQIKNAHFLNSFIIGEENTSGELKVYLTDSGIGLGWIK